MSMSSQVRGVFARGGTRSLTTRGGVPEFQGAPARIKNGSLKALAKNLLV